MQNLFGHLFGGVYKDKTVLITGHTGFKGAWLSYWLSLMGAHVVGYSLEAPTKPNHLELLHLDIPSVVGDIRDQDHLRVVFSQYQPEVVFHLAAQPLLRESYVDPIETFDVNVLGTAKILDCCRNVDSVKAILVISSDKCYENQEWVWGYRESDAMGGIDPYSASKGCTELVTSSYRRSFFPISGYGTVHHKLLASARAGNVVGGGDWARDRLICDIVRAASNGKKVIIRNPEATRPWQHVLEALSGYLTLVQRLLQNEALYAEGWNFGPSLDGTLTVKQILDMACQYWEQINYAVEHNHTHPHEASLLRLDSSKAHSLLQWQSVWNIETTIQKTIDWYKQFYINGNLNTKADLLGYIQSASSQGLVWANGVHSEANR